MIKSIFFLKRKPGTSVEAFLEYWREKHGPLVKQMPGLRKYVQSHTIPSAYRKGEPLYDGVAELWYDDVESLRRTNDSPHGKAAMADNERYVDMSKIAFLATEEHVQKAGPTDDSMVKLVEFVKRRPDMSVEAFREYWRTIHGPLAAKLPDMRRYVQCHPLPSAYRAGRQPLYDGVVNVWFESTDAMRHSERAPEYAAVRADEPNFIDVAKLCFIITREHRVL